MKEIKFRAWDSVKKYMSNCAGIDWSSGNMTFRKWSGINLNCKEDALTQYTGLEDKNGKEIYEGDIIELTLFSPDDEDTQYICKVVFESGCFILACNELEDSFTNFIHKEEEQFEVIGNIYQNPEMIK